MSENNRTYRIHTNINSDKFLNVNLTQDVDELNILSLKISTENAYRLHTSKYGCLVGRVLANGGVGIPNVKLSVFVPIDAIDRNDSVLSYLYPYDNVKSKNWDGIRYNLLPDFVNDKCHQDIGTFPNKRLVLDDDNVLEIYDKYYKFTTTTNDAGDYMIFGLPTGNNIIHSELDLSDIGILSQKPRDLFYKGYNHTMFENSSQFKKDTNLDNLTQVISQDDSVYVYSFWGDDETENYEGADHQVKITRNDINISYKFEPTCIFIGSLVADEKSQGFSKKCVPTTRMGKMDRLTTGSGTIEMIRKTPTGEVESFPIQGNDLIDGNGTWCYQIPMNLDYVKTDEFGNLVPAENENVGIPTRTRVRFRVSLADYESDSANAHLAKMLVPNNPDEETNYDADYNFGHETRDDSFRDLLWNNVYTVKEYIPRIQKIRRIPSTLRRKRIDRNKNFSGIKTVNVNGSNNPIPYNNIRVQLTFLFIFQCIIFKSIVLIVKIMNALVYVVALITCNNCGAGGKEKSETNKGGGCTGRLFRKCGCGDESSCDALSELRYITLDGAVCPETDGWLFALGAKKTDKSDDTSTARKRKAQVIYHTSEWAMKDSNPAEDVNGNNWAAENSGAQYQMGDDGGDADSSGDYSPEGTMTMPKNETDGPYYNDPYSADGKYAEKHTDINVSGKEDFFVKCVELQFAMEYEVIQFDFYNDWLNGCLYFPRWFAELRKRRRKSRIMACDNNFNKTNMALVQQCAVRYTLGNENTGQKTMMVYDAGAGYGHGDVWGCGSSGGKCHKGEGRDGIRVLGRNGVVHFVQNDDERFLYYLRPNEFASYGNNQRYKRCNLFATDIVLLGNTNECNINGIPQAIGYPSSTFIMPPPTVQIEDESQEAELSNDMDYSFKAMSDGGNWQEDHNFYKLNSIKENSNEKEISGIDWGYNPYPKVDNGNVYNPGNQKAGHFLEIGCINSMTTVKSCINLQRICELGAEMSQSHYGISSAQKKDSESKIREKEDDKEKQKNNIENWEKDIVGLKDKTSAQTYNMEVLQSGITKNNITIKEERKEISEKNNILFDLEGKKCLQFNAGQIRWFAGGYEEIEEYKDYTSQDEKITLHFSWFHVFQWYLKFYNTEEITEQVVNPTYGEVNPEKIHDILTGDPSTYSLNEIDKKLRVTIDISPNVACTVDGNFCVYATNIINRAPFFDIVDLPKFIENTRKTLKNLLEILFKSDSKQYINWYDGKQLSTKEIPIIINYIITIGNEYEQDPNRDDIFDGMSPLMDFYHFIQYWAQRNFVFFKTSELHKEIDELQEDINKKLEENKKNNEKINTIYSTVKDNLDRITKLKNDIREAEERIEAIDDEIEQLKLNFIHATGTVANREIVSNSIRSKFAALNSSKLLLKDGEDNYRYRGYVPNAFDGTLSPMKNKNILRDIIDTQSASYLHFRFGGKTPKFSTNVSSGSIHYHQMPIYENSFYFYFGLKDGNTAIDRLYTEYFSECADKTTETVAYSPNNNENGNWSVSGSTDNSSYPTNTGDNDQWTNNSGRQGNTN